MDTDLAHASCLNAMSLWSWSMSSQSLYLFSLPARGLTAHIIAISRRCERITTRMIRNSDDSVPLRTFMMYSGCLPHSLWRFDRTSGNVSTLCMGFYAMKKNIGNARMSYADGQNGAAGCWYWCWYWCRR